MQLIPIYSELVNPSYTRIKKVVVRSFIIDMVIYIFVACACYFSTFNYTNSIALTRDPLPNFSPDYAMLTASVLVFAVVFSAYPLYCVPWRNQLFLIALGWKEYS